MHLEEGYPTATTKEADRQTRAKVTEDALHSISTFRLLTHLDFSSNKQKPV